MVYTHAPEALIFRHNLIPNRCKYCDFSVKKTSTRTLILGEQSRENVAFDTSYSLKNMDDRVRLDAKEIVFRREKIEKT